MNRITKETIRSHTLCLKTDASGAIPLACSALEILNEAARRFATLYLQSKHSYARLVSAIHPVPFYWIEEGKLAASDDQRLILRPSSHDRWLARIQHCACCGSSGRIELRDTTGAELFQICSPSTLSAYDWGSYIQHLSLSPNQSRPAANHYPFPRIPGNAKPLPFHPTLLPTLLNQLCDENCRIEVTLANQASIHRSQIDLEAINVEDTLLTAYSKQSSFQLDISAAHKLSLSFTANRMPQLYVSGEENSQLLLIEPASQHSDANTFYDFLYHLVPGLF